MIKRFGILTKVEKIIVVFLLMIVLVTAYQIGRAFYVEYSDIKPLKGGIYIEGAVGKLSQLNPLFVQFGSVNDDIAHLIFSGLTKYDSKTGEIIPDLADFKITPDGKTYTFTIKDNAKWQDGEKVTSDDVIFTYNNVIKNPAFKGTILNYNDYSGIKVIKTDDRIVQFLLESPDAFFLVKTLPGLLPAHILGSTPVEELDGDPFNQSPIGSGPFRLVSLMPMDNYMEVNLEANDDYYGGRPNITTIQYRIFGDIKDLIKKSGELDAIRNVPDDSVNTILKKTGLSMIRYTLPQYVAVFINTQSDKLKNSKIRLALQLGTDKDSLVKEIGQEKTIDTPLLEIDQSNWMLQYSTNKANGALFDTEWQIPNKTTAAEITTKSQDKDDKKTDGPKYITSPNNGENWQTTDKMITLTGTVPEKTKSVSINDYELKKFVPGDKSWSYVASFEYGNLAKGNNIFNVYVTNFSGDKNLIDSITINQGTADELNSKDLEKVSAENDAASNLPIRRNKAGEQLILQLAVPETPTVYLQIADILKEQWKKIGIGVDIKKLSPEEFQVALLKRNYDLLIFGQNLVYNLDAYPYWHSSQAKGGGYNLSQFKNFAVDSLLEKARSEGDDKSRQKLLNSIQEIISKEVPAIFLYTPTYHFAISDKMQSVDFSHLATISDRFSHISEWYARADRKLNADANILTFFSWLGKQFRL